VSLKTAHVQAREWLFGPQHSANNDGVFHGPIHKPFLGPGIVCMENFKKAYVPEIKDFYIHVPSD
jgi:hypothetical protein